MQTSDCRGCKKVLRATLAAGKDITKLKMVAGHLEGCPALSPPTTSKPATTPKEATSEPEPPAYPWSEQNYRIAPSQRTAPGEPAAGRTHDGGRTGDVAAHPDPAGGADRSTPRRAEPRPARRRNGDAECVQHRGRARVPHPGHQEVAAPKQQKPPPIQQFKVVDHANRGEQKDHRKGVWFVVLVVAAVLTIPVYPPLALLFIGAIAMLFLL